MPEDPKPVFEFGPYSLDTHRRLLRKADEVIPLTSKVFDTLLALVQNHHRLMEKDELLKLIWTDTVVEERNLAVNISTLRKVLGESASSHNYIVTVPGRGYRFVAPVREANESSGSGINGSYGSEMALPSDVQNVASRKTAAPLDWQSRLRKPLLSIGLLAGFIVSFAVGRYSTSATARLSMRFSSITNFAGVEGQPSFSPDGRSVAFVSDRGGQYDIFVGLLTGGSLVRVTNDSNVEARPKWSPDGSKLLYARLNESGLWDSWVIPALGGTPHKISSNAMDPAWSPDGQSIAYANLTTGTIWLCDASGRESHPLTKPENAVVHRQPAISRDAKKLAFVRRIEAGGPYGELSVVEPGGIHEARSLTKDGAFVGSPKWSPDGKTIYFASGRGGGINIWKVNARGGTPEQITVGPGDDADLDLSSDGRRLVFSTYRINSNLGEIVLNGTSQPAIQWLTSDPVRGELAPAYSHDGKHIAYFTTRRGAERESVWIMDHDGGNPSQLAEDERVNAYPRWSEDGKSLFYFSIPGGTGSFGQASELRRLPVLGGTLQHVPFTVRDPYGDVGPQDKLLYPAADGSVKIFDPKTNRSEALTGITGTHLRWCPDGRRFAAIVSPKEENDARVGLWVHSLDGKHQQVFRGWIAFYGWAGPDELLVLEGKPDLQAKLWRVRLDGSRETSGVSIRLIYSYWHNLPVTRFDVHPDGRHVVTEGIELHQADLSMIEDIR